VPLAERLPGGTDLGLYRILQESLENVRKHARARHVTVSLARTGSFIHLTIADDGTGFDPKRRRTRGKGKVGLGLPGMGERAIYMGGALTIKSARGTGTEIEARIPLLAGPIV
jgi:two-component system NarL family sensor kinase